MEVNNYSLFSLFKPCQRLSILYLYLKFCGAVNLKIKFLCEKFDFLRISSDSAKIALLKKIFQILCLHFLTRHKVRK